MNFKQKIDAFLMMGVYLVPVLVGLGLLLTTIIGSSLISQIFIVAEVFLIFGSVGNFAPFFEVVFSMRMDGRKMRPTDLVLLAVSFFFNVLISTDALVSLLKDKLLGKHLIWVPTIHTGSIS